jgi:hypothetical protein
MQKAEPERMRVLCAECSWVESLMLVALQRLTRGEEMTVAPAEQTHSNKTAIDRSALITSLNTQQSTKEMKSGMGGADTGNGRRRGVTRK